TDGVTVGILATGGAIHASDVVIVRSSTAVQIAQSNVQIARSLIDRPRVGIFLPTVGGTRSLAITSTIEDLTISDPTLDAIDIRSSPALRVARAEISGGGG